MVSTCDCYPRGPGFDSRLYSRNYSGSIGSGTGSTQPHEDNWVASDMRSSKIRLRKLKLWLRDNILLTTRLPALPSGYNRVSRSLSLVAVAPGIFNLLLFYYPLSSFQSLWSTIAKRSPTILSTPVVQWLSYSPLDPKFAGSNPAGVDGFFSERKNPEYDFLRNGSKAVGPVS